MSDNPYHVSASRRPPVPLDPPIRLEGALTAADVKAALRLKSASITLLSFHLLLGLGLLGCLGLAGIAAMFFGLEVALAPLLVAGGVGFIWLRLIFRTFGIGSSMRHALRPGGALVKPVRGMVTTAGIDFAASEAGSAPRSYPWEHATDARIGDRVAMVVFLAGLAPEVAGGEIQTLILPLSRNITTSDEQWQRLRSYLAQMFPTPPSEKVGPMHCARCGVLRETDELHQVALWLRCCWPPLLLGPAFGRPAPRYCRSCRRSVSFALFFIFFSLLLILALQFACSWLLEVSAHSGS